METKNPTFEEKVVTAFEAKPWQVGVTCVYFSFLALASLGNVYVSFQFFNLIVVAQMLGLAGGLLSALGVRELWGMKKRALPILYGATALQFMSGLFLGVVNPFVVIALVLIYCVKKMPEELT